jgi:uncharacterized protein (TIGR03083 family)
MGEVTVTEVVDALDEVWSSIAALTEDLDEVAWATPTVCPGWDVKDLLSHMIGTERSIEGEPTPAIELPLSTHVRNPIGEMNERWVQSRRTRSGSEVRDEFIEVIGRRLDALRSQSPESFEVVGWSPIGQVPLRVFMTVRVMDCWLHEQDARAALGRPGGRDGAGERLSLLRADAALGMVFGKAVRPGDGTSVALEISGPLGSRRRLEMVDGRAVAVDGADATVTITLEPLSYLERFGGRISTAEALERSTTNLEGDEVLAGAVLGALAVMI